MSHVRIVVNGYGKFNLAKKIVLTDGLKSIPLSFKRRCFFAISNHSLAELNMFSSDASYIQPKYPIFSRVKKNISLGVTSRRLLSGIFNGFTLSVEVEKDFFTSPPYFKADNEPIYVARVVGRSGLIIEDYNATLEYSVRRRQVNSKIFLLEADLFPITNTVKSFREVVVRIEISENQKEAVELLKRLPSWHGLRTYFSLLFDSTEAFNSTNVFRPLNPSIETLGETRRVRLPKPFADVYSKSRQISDIPIFFALTLQNVNISHGSNITKDGFIIFDDSSYADFNFESAMWPTLKWSHPNTDLIATPHIESPKSEGSRVGFIPWNSNWAHFMEDIAPRAAMLANCSPAVKKYYSKTSDKTQLELFDLLNVKPLHGISFFESISFEELTFVFHHNQRNRLVDGDESGQVLCTDITIMNEIRSTVFRQINQAQEQSNKLFVYRESRLFRRLVNQRRVIKLLERQGFLSIDITNWSLESRIKLYSSCSHIVYEYGAGGANNYFAQDGVNVVELRHPRNLDSVEQLGYISVSNSNWIYVGGLKANVLLRFIFGSDSWRIPVAELRKSLKQLDAPKCL